MILYYILALYFSSLAIAHEQQETDWIISRLKKNKKIIYTWISVIE